MKLIKTIVLTEVAGDYIAVPVGEATNRFNGVVRLNKTGRDIVQGLIDGLESCVRSRRNWLPTMTAWILTRRGRPHRALQTSCGQKVY